MYLYTFVLAQAFALVTVPTGSMTPLDLVHSQRHVRLLRSHNFLKLRDVSKPISLPTMPTWESRYETIDIIGSAFKKPTALLYLPNKSSVNEG